jgi:hypothetical protein
MVRVGRFDILNTEVKQEAKNYHAQLIINIQYLLMLTVLAGVYTLAAC